MHTKHIQMLTALICASASLTLNGIHEIKTMKEYDEIKAKSGPKVIVYNSSTCTACDLMKKGLDECERKYNRVRFYKLDATHDSFKGLPKKEGITGYPTTHFHCPGKDVRKELGSMGDDEIDEITYEMHNGKKRPYVAPKPAPQKKK